jgi:ribonuclease HII
VADFAIESRLWAEGIRYVAGVDEAGRGPLAGPLVVAAVILPQGWDEPVALEDSKRLAPAQREAAFPVLLRRAVAWRAVVVPPEVIDRVNILRATLGAMAGAVAALKVAPQWVIVDGDRLPPPERHGRCRWECIVGGDGRSATIAAASIVAKVVRDRLMRVYGKRYPEWGFGEHKGYGTPAHLAALERFGPSPIHRRSFRAGGKAWANRERPQGAAPEQGAKPLPLATWNG